MVWNYHDEDKQEAAKTITVLIKGIPAAKVTVTEYRIDNEHSNSYEVWKKMGSPQQPTTEQIAMLEKAGQLQAKQKAVRLKTANQAAQLKINLPVQGVTLLKLDW